MPEYILMDFDGVWSWVKLPNGKYLVDLQHEKEFIYLHSSQELSQMQQQHS